MSKKRIAVIPIYKDKGKIKLFLVTGRSSGRWILPTGKYEELLPHKHVATLEAFEECGVVGRIDKTFCKTVTTRPTKNSSKKELRLYRMYVKEVHQHWPEKGQRERILVPLKSLSKWIKDKRLAKQVMQYASV